MKERPTVLHLDHATEAGGAELALIRMVEIGPTWTPMVLVPGRDAGIFSASERARAVVRTLGPPQEPLAKASGLWGHIGLMRRTLSMAYAVRRSESFRSSQLIHANTSRASIYGALACIGSRKKFVVHLRDEVSVETLGRVGLFMVKNLALRRADGIIANSNFTLHSADLRQRKSLLAVVPSPAGLKMTMKGPPSSVAVSRIGMVARIAPWKGQALLLKALALMPEQIRPELHLAGAALFADRGYELYLRRLANELGISNRVRFLGHVDDVPAFLAAMDIAVHASTRPEPLGQNVLQYLASGLPTVAANSGGPTEWIEDGRNGLLFETGSESDLAAKLVRLTSDRALRLGLAAAALSTPGLMTDAAVTRRHGEFFDAVLGKVTSDG